MNYRPTFVVLAAFLTALPLTFARADEATSSGMDSSPAAHSWDASKMQKKFGLSDDQVSKLKGIMDAQKTALKPLWDKQRDLMKTLAGQVKSKAQDADIKTTLDALQANRQAMHDQMEQFKTQKEALLTPTQQAQMLLARMKHMKNMKHEGKGMSHGNSSNAPAASPSDAPPATAQ